MFLDEFVMKHVDQERLERWLIRKTRKLKQKGRHPSADQETSKQNGKKRFNELIRRKMLDK
jgi:two-component SAPR family response regulator